MLKTSILVSLMAMGLFFNACSNNDEKQLDEANAVLSTNDFVLTALDNKQYNVTKTVDGFSVEGQKGKVIIIDIFATWCPPCQAEATHLSSLQKKYKDSLLVMGVTVEDNIDNAKLQKFRAEHNANYTLVNSNENSRLIDAVALQLRVGNNFGIPLMALYKDGVFLKYYQGATEEEFLEQDIKEALGL